MSKFLFLNTLGKELLIIQVHIDDVTFEATFEMVCEEIIDLLTVSFEMGIMEELNLFLEL